MKRLTALVLLLCCLTGCACADWPMADSYNWYEVFVYSYQDSDGDGIGDLPGLISRLDYIADMGYTGLWLMPIMPSPSYHKYDVTDYKSVDPQYGTVEDFKTLVREAHTRGIRVIIDLPVNHSSSQHPWFLAACEALRAGNMDHPYIDYYHFTTEAGQKTVPVSGTDWHYEEQFSGGGMPDLNLANEAVLAEIRDIMSFWLADCGADGFRLDAVTSFFTGDTEKNVVVLDRLKDMAEEIKPGSYLVAEAWVGLEQIAEYYHSDVDSFFLFPVSQAEGYIVRALRSRGKPASTFADYMQKIEAAIPADQILAPFLCNHDTGRTVPALQARSAPAKAKFAEGVMNMMRGNVFTYYGEEIGMVGSGDDPNKRLPMYWNDTGMTNCPPGVTKVEYAYPSADAQLADPDSLLNYCRAVNHVRLRHPAIARGDNTWIHVDDWTCVMQRTLGEDTLYIAMNFSSSKAQTIELPVDGLAIAEDVETGTEVAALTGATLTLPPYAIVILQ
ncbi:MAG: hypothetical protein IKK21_02355 [Clostridia bacterium]|nr:hypothetical protein [Clostridia bacterium]